jgi:hypothetical protein
MMDDLHQTGQDLATIWHNMWAATAGVWLPLLIVLCVVVPVVRFKDQLMGLPWGQRLAHWFMAPPVGEPNVMPYVLAGIAVPLIVVGLALLLR